MAVFVKIRGAVDVGDLGTWATLIPGDLVALYQIENHEGGARVRSGLINLKGEKAQATAGSWLEKAKVLWPKSAIIMYDKVGTNRARLVGRAREKVFKAQYDFKVCDDAQGLK